jgi:putative phage-type endonuclease
MQLYAPEKFNKAELVGVFDSGSADWLEARYSGIGGSDIGTILGLNPYESAYALWAKKTKQIPESDLSDNIRVKFGQKFEQPILEMWAENNPDWVVYHTGTYRDSERPYMMANPDALAHNPTTDEWMVIEVKTSAMPWDEVPMHYHAQVLHYLSVMGLTKAKLIGVVGWNWWESDIVADDFEIGVQREYAAKFWESIQLMRKPEWDGSEATFKAVKAMNPLIDDTEIEITWGAELVLMQEKADAAYRDLNRLKSITLDAMGKARHAYSIIDGKEVRVASRQMRAGAPTLIVRRK